MCGSVGETGSDGSERYPVASSLLRVASSRDHIWAMPAVVGLAGKAATSLASRQAPAVFATPLRLWQIWSVLSLCWKRSSSCASLA